MQCGLAMIILFVCLSNVWIMTKQKKDLSRFLSYCKPRFFACPLFREFASLTSSRK